MVQSTSQLAGGLSVELEWVLGGATAVLAEPMEALGSVWLIIAESL